LLVSVVAEFSRGAGSQVRVLGTHEKQFNKPEVVPSPIIHTSHQ
jgi:hypothetical protein